MSEDIFKEHRIIRLAFCFCHVKCRKSTGTENY